MKVFVFNFLLPRHMAKNRKFKNQQVTLCETLYKTCNVRVRTACCPPVDVVKKKAWFQFLISLQRHSKKLVFIGQINFHFGIALERKTLKWKMHKWRRFTCKLFIKPLSVVIIFTNNVRMQLKNYCFIIGI